MGTESAILGRQVELLYRNIPIGQGVSVLNACILAWLWRDATGTGATLAWLGLALLVALGRGWLALAYHRSPPAPHHKAHPWLSRARLGAALGGATWAGGAALFMLTGDTVQLVFTAFVMAGMVAGAVPVLAADRVAFRAYAWPILITCWFAALGTEPVRLAFAALSIIFLLAMTRSADHFHQSLADSFRLEQEKGALVADLERAKGLAEASDRAKSRFLANVSHELRTPMNGIMGMAELLSMDDLTPQQQELLAPLRSSADELLAKIDNLIELSALETGQSELSAAPFNLPDLLTNALGPERRAAAAKGLAFHLAWDPHLPPLVVGDAARVGRMLHHLAGNAVKFTAAGEVEVEASLGARTEVGIRVVLVVRDTGCGIPADQMEGALGLFTQGDTSATRRHEGTGIGLPLSRKLAEALGGSLAMESVPGEGTTVRVELPFAMAKA